MNQEQIGLLILVPCNMVLWLMVGFSVGHRRTQGWAAVTLLYIMWTIQLATIGQLTAIATAVNACVFFIITVYRYRREDPGSAIKKYDHYFPWHDED